jgi:hypothetical protein
MHNAGGELLLMGILRTSRSRSSTKFPCRIVHRLPARAASLQRGPSLYLGTVWWSLGALLRESYALALVLEAKVSVSALLALLLFRGCREHRHWERFIDAEARITELWGHVLQEDSVSKGSCFRGNDCNVHRECLARAGRVVAAYSVTCYGSRGEGIIVAYASPWACV